MGATRNRDRVRVYARVERLAGGRPGADYDPCWVPHGRHDDGRCEVSVDDAGTWRLGDAVLRDVRTEGD